MILACAPSAWACHPSTASSSKTDAPSSPRVAIEGPSGRNSAVRVELARTPAEQARGLMFRERLGADEGMLFIFGESAEHTFWMKNTSLSLDMIFADSDGIVVGTVERAEPLSLTPRGVTFTSRYVLEVNGGWSAEHGVRAGDRLHFEGFAP